MKQYKNGKTVFNKADIDSLKPDSPDTDGTLSLLAAIAGYPDPIRHPEEFKAAVAADAETE